MTKDAPLRGLSLALHAEFETPYWVVRSFCQMAREHGMGQLGVWWKRRKSRLFFLACQNVLRQEARSEGLTALALRQMERFLARHAGRDLVVLIDRWQEQESRLAESGARAATWLDENYPPELRELDQPPPVLWANRPLAEFLAGRRIAMIGSRKMTQDGEKGSRQFGAAVAKAGLIIVSGCARGTDWECQRSGLLAGGKSIGVLGSGLNFMPERCGSWRESDNLLLLSEFPPNAPPEKWRFPFRNRLISALSEAVFVIEAGEKSGTFITASAAAEQGKDVLVLSQAFYSPNAQACRLLTQKGARLVVAENDVWDELGLERREESDSQMDRVLQQAVNPTERSLLRSLLERGGQALGETLKCPPQITSDEWEKARWELETRGVITEQMGVWTLSCMIQS